MALPPPTTTALLSKMLVGERAAAVAAAAATRLTEGLRVHRRRHAAAASRRLLVVSGCFALACAIGVGVSLLRLMAASRSAAGADDDGGEGVLVVVSAASAPAAAAAAAATTRAAGAASRAGGGGGGLRTFEGPECPHHQVDNAASTAAAAASDSDGGRAGAAGLLRRRWSRGRGGRRDGLLTDCRALWAAVAEATYVGQGWTKAVYSARYGGGGGGGGGGERVAVKAVSFEAHDMRQCLATGADKADCYADVSAKLLREAAVLRCVSHDNIVQLVAYCSPDVPDVSESSSLAAVITELGEPLDLLKVLQMSWESRLRVALGIARLTDYFARYKLVLNDYKKEQFVLVNGIVKLADLDDVGRYEPTCLTDADCINHLVAFNFTLRSHCVQGACLGYNEKLNVINAGRHFMDVLLSYGTPSPLSDSARSIAERYRTAAGSASELLTAVTRLARNYRIVRRAGSSMPESARRGPAAAAGPAVLDYTRPVVAHHIGASGKVSD